MSEAIRVWRIVKIAVYAPDNPFVRHLSEDLKAWSGGPLPSIQGDGTFSASPSRMPLKAEPWLRGKSSSTAPFLS